MLKKGLPGVTQKCMIMLMRFWKWLFLTALLFSQPLPAADGPTIVAAHYYSWYGGNENPHWPDGVAHKPWLGYYSSASPGVVQQQIDLARTYGIDVFAVGWTGIDSPGERKFKAGFMKAPNLNRIQFCLVYDSLSRLRGENSQPLYFDMNDPVVRQLFVSDLVYIANNYFGHPSYFKLHGRPVLKIYLARRFFGEFPAALEEARQQIRTLGWDPYLVGDSLFYGKNDLFVISQFDAATSYNVYSDDLLRTGIRTTGELAKAIRPWYWNFMEQLKDVISRNRGVPVDLQPGIIPQFDPRNARKTQSALLALNKDEVKAIFRVARDIVDAKPAGEKVVWITSWNEWHEGTAIEPTESGGRKYPGGNYGYDFLEALSEVFGK